MNKKLNLVFLHYFGGAASSWRWVIEKLPDDYNCIALDLPGFGGTPALPELSIKSFVVYVRDEMTNRRIENYILIGHSMGGKIALQVAAVAGKDEVTQLILIAPSPPTTEPMPKEEKQRMLHHPDRKEAEISVRKSTIAELTPDQRQLAIATQLMVDHETWRWWILQGMEHSIAEEIENVKIPITVLVSDDDPVITPETIEKSVMPFLKNAELRTIENVGHLIPLEAPQWLAEEIQNCVRREQQQIKE